MSKMAFAQFSWPIVGHANIVSYLQQCLENSQLAHAYLFVGPEHIGKSTVVNYFVNAVIGSLPAVSINAEDSGQKFHPDIHWLNREVNDKTDKLKKNISRHFRIIKQEIYHPAASDSVSKLFIRSASCRGKVRLPWKTSLRQNKK